MRLVDETGCHFVGYFSKVRRVVVIVVFMKSEIPLVALVGQNRRLFGVCHPGEIIKILAS